MEREVKFGGVFSPDLIQEYWNNQEAYSGSEKFTDSNFPPNRNSILGLDAQGQFLDKIDGPKKSQEISDVNNIEWKRASEIYSKYLLFDDKIECSDIKQGNLGNCYFLSALAALTEFPQLIYQVFRTKQINSQGYYEVVLFLDGEWKVVIVDDYFPVKKGTKEFAFARPNGCELWVVLLEKAWAKVNGGYANIISGWPSDALAALTGFATQKLVHKDINILELWNILKTADNNDNIMCSSTKNDKSIENVGLVVNHAYTLIGAKELNYGGEEIKLVQLRNPWGYREWTGDWSDSSKRWNPQLNQYFGHTNQDDGNFFMKLEDFVSLFDSTHVCYVMYDSNIKSFKINSNDMIEVPHVFNIYIPTKTRFAVSVLTKHWRYNRNLKNLYHPFSMVIAKYNFETKQFSNVDGSYSAYENLEWVDFLNEGLYAIWICCGYNYCKSPKPEEYYVRFASTAKYSAKLECYDPGFELIQEMMTSAVKETYRKEILESSEFFYKIENQFRRTGIGYRFVLNKTSNKHQKWTNDASGLDKMFLFAPFEGLSNFTFDVPTGGSAIVLGMRTEEFGTYWFNIKSSYTTFTGGVDDSVVRKVSIENFISNDVQYEDIDDFYYDYISSSISEAKLILQFDKIDIKKVALEDLLNSHPKLMNLIINLQPIFEDQDLSWSKIDYENGYYLGQLTSNKSRHGRGVYYWTTDGSIYAGYWKDNIKEIYGKVLDSNFKVTYEGQYSKGKRFGKGKLTFSNGDTYEGSFVDDKRDGSGVYTWADGKTWTGSFVNNLMHGKGIYNPNDGSDPWQVEYRNGKYVS